MKRKSRSGMLAGLLLFAPLVQLCLYPAGLANAAMQEADSAPDFPEIEFTLPEGSEEFGNPDFEVAESVTTDEAAAGAMIAALMSAACTGFVALLVGLVVGYFIGKGRRPAAPASESSASGT